MPNPNRRRFLATATTATTVALAGCTSLTNTITGSGNGVENCPESPTKIEDIDTSSNDRIYVVGTVTAVDETNETVTISGDTGKIIITKPPGYPPEGECVRVDAIPQGCIGSGCRNGTYVQALNIYDETTTSS